MAKWIVCGVAVVFGAMRLTLPTHGLNAQDVFKDMAHLFVGGLFGAAIASKRRWLWLTAGALTLLEVAAAIIRR